LPIDDTSLIGWSPRVENVKKSETISEILERVTKDVVDVFAALGILTHQERIAVFQATLTYLNRFTGLSDSHIQCLSVHAFIDLVAQFNNDADTIQLDVELVEGTYFYTSYIFILHIYYTRYIYIIHNYTKTTFNLHLHITI
jgi:hypothetical protein